MQPLLLQHQLETRCLLRRTLLVDGRPNADPSLPAAEQQWPSRVCVNVALHQRTAAAGRLCSPTPTQPGMGHLAPPADLPQPLDALWQRLSCLGRLGILCILRLCIVIIGCRLCLQGYTSDVKHHLVAALMPCNAVVAQLLPRPERFLCEGKPNQLISAADAAQGS